MAWYTILFITTFVIFAVKFIMSWFFGDLDMDVDFDGDSDFDTSSAFSFKGLTHFLMGFSAYLLLRSSMETVEKVNGVAHFGAMDYVYATIIGVILTLLLIWGYTLALKATHESKNPQDYINNCKGNIYLNLGNGQYSVEAHTPAGTTNVTAFYTSDDLEPGMEVSLVKEGNNILIYKEDV